MKKLLLLLFIAIFILSLSSCDDKMPKNENSKELKYANKYRVEKRW